MQPDNENPVPPPNKVEPRPRIHRLLEVGLTLAANQWIRFVGLTLYYLAILIGLIVLYGRGDFSTPAFVYQGF
jgi:hypothetical protein